MDLSELERLENPAKVLKLSEAIRIGAKIRQKCYGYLFRDGASCALGAAYEAMFGYPDKADYLALHHGGALAIKLINAFSPPLNLSLTRDIGRMSDSGMTREAIADRLEAIGL